MILRSARGALVTAALFLGACQTGFYQSPAPAPVMTPMDGVWSSTDGVFVATFERGGFTSRFTATNEILAQGSYTVAGNMVTLAWMSVATQQRRSANCTINTPDSVTCNQDGGGHFELARNAPGAVAPAAAAAVTPPPAIAPGPAPAPVQ
jgi:hypothetical protein